MDCCSTKGTDPNGTDPKGAQTCPGCGQRGRKVKPITLDSLTQAGTPRVDEPYRFCATQDCDTAWYSEDTGHIIPVARSRVAISQKETGPDRTLCYCFGFTAADINRDMAQRGDSTIPDQIAAHCRKGEDHCPETNPQGSCCLGNIRAAMKSYDGTAPTTVQTKQTEQTEQTAKQAQAGASCSCH